jgi:tRNA (cytidine32/uridine32-2'-O)-methyltransferase
LNTLFQRIRIVLVEPSHPGNIGGTARAMKTMGLHQLVLVNPARYPDPQADWRAAGAMDVLDGARVVMDVTEAIADCHYVIGTSTRARAIPWPAVLAKDLGPVLVEQAQDAEIAILFGREDSGLSNDELQRCHTHLQIPSSKEYGSLNLAMAVQVICYEIFQYMEQTSVQVSADSQSVQEEVSAIGRRIWDKDPASGVQMDKLIEHLEQVMVASGFVDPANPGNTVTRLRRLFMRQQLDETEVQILRGMLKAVQRRMK